MNNQTNSTLRNESAAYGIPIFAQITFLLSFGIIAVLAFFGNCMVIWIVLTHRRMRTPTNYFLVNLAYADVLNALINIPFNGYYMVTQEPWPFGNFMCPCVQAVSHISIAANVLTHVAISLDRYFAIIHPLRTKLTHQQTILIIVSIWILSATVSSPAIHSFIIRTIDDCKASLRYEWIFFLVTYVGPIVILTITYTRIGIELWGQTAIGEVTKRQRDCIQSKRKVVKMLIAVVLIFGICWFPQQLYLILISFYETIMHWHGTAYVYLTSYTFAMSNSMYNPFLYCCMNNRFRDGFRSVFAFCPCTRWTNEYSGALHRSIRSLSDATALNVVYSSQRKARVPQTTNNSSPSSRSTITDFAANSSRRHLQAK